MRIFLALPAFLGALALADGAAAQIGQQNQLEMQLQAQQQQALDQERQAVVQQQRAQTNQALSDLSATRPAPALAPLPVGPPPSAAQAIRADQLRTLADEVAARPTRLRLRPYLVPQP